MASSPSVTEVADRLARAARVVALTGAGISTPCGIPDFRGPKGIYVTRRYREDIFDIETFVVDPRGFYEFARDFLALEDRIQPSLTHRVLARMEREGILSGIVTQNIDGLHQRAGSSNVLELHGGFSSAACVRCRRPVVTQGLRAVIERGDVPCCEDCGGVIKPEVVFFGENVRHLDEAMQLVLGSDLLLVLGSSLTVFPAASLPHMAGGEVVVVNQGPVSLPPGASYVDAGTDELMAAVAARLGFDPTAP